MKTILLSFFKKKTRIPQWVGRSSLIACFFVTLMGPLAQNVNACIDLDTTVIIICNYDSNYVDMELRITNLRLMQEQPNKFCSCAVTSYSTIFTDLKYVAFVDSGTNNVYPGFAAWSNEVAANNSWNSDQPSTGGWKGFIAEVINSGLSPTTPVELIVRAGLPPGYTFAFLDSAISTSSVGADEWNNTTQTLANSHQEVKYFWDSPSRTFNNVSTQYFKDLDADITTGIKEFQLLQGVNISPNPIQDQLELSFHSAQPAMLEVHVFDLAGRNVGALYQGQIPSGPHKLHLPVGDLDLRSGTYLLRMSTGSGVISRKILKIE